MRVLRSMSWSVIVALVATLLACRPSVPRAAAADAAPSAQIKWNSPTTGGAVGGRVILPEMNRAPKTLPTVIYLSHLSAPRLGTESDDAILGDFTTSGYIVLVLNYEQHANAKSPELNADLLKLREDLGAKKLLADYHVDLNHTYIVAEGCRLKRDVVFANDKDKNRVLAMDIIYPSNPAKPVPVLAEYTCDNASRMGNASLVFCHDTLVEGAPLAGFAGAMLDHPVAPPYKGLDDPIPDVVYRLKASIRTLRAAGTELGLSGKIGVIGFSRGGPMAAIVAVSNGQKELEGVGEHRDVSSDVQAALIHGNRYDYLRLRSEDPMLDRFTKAWGDRRTNADRWAAHGALYYLKSSAVPMFLNTSDAESPEYRAGLLQLDQKLTELGVDHEYQLDKDGRGHRVSTDPQTLGKIYQFFDRHLTK